MQRNPKNFQEALEVIEKRDLRIELLENKVSELENELEMQRKLLGQKRNFSEKEQYYY